MRTTYKILIVINVLILIVTACVVLRIQDLRRDCAMESAAQSWGDGAKYAQVSFYYSIINGFTTQKAYTKRSEVEKELRAQGVIEKNEETRKWIDCAYGETTLQCLSESGRKTDAVVTGIWGEFFVFHPEKLIFGSYIDSDVKNYDVVVLDDLAAWRLFGSVDCVGLNTMIGDKLFRVVGVIESPTDKTETKAYGKDPHVYIPADALQILKEGAQLSVYEVCVPEKVKGFGMTVAEDVDKETYSAGNVVDQTRRFDIVELVTTYNKIPETALVSAGFSYPWFENLARMGELQARIIAYPTALALIVTAVSLVVLMFEAAKGFGRLAGKVRGRYDRAYQKKLKKEYYKTHMTPEEREKAEEEQRRQEEEERKRRRSQKPIPPSTAGMIPAAATEQAGTAAGQTGAAGQAEATAEQTGVVEQTGIQPEAQAADRAPEDVTADMSASDSPSEQVTQAAEAEESSGN